MSQRERRVVITGIGVICPLGTGKEALWEALASGRSGVVPLADAPATLPVKFGAAAQQFRTDDIESFGPLDKERKKAIRKGLKMMCRECQMGVAAAQAALDDAKLAPGKVDPERIGCSFGTDHTLTMPDDFTEGVAQCIDGQGRFQFPQWATDGLPKMSPLWLLKYLPNMPASHVAIYNDLRGPNNSLTMREAAANAAVAEAYQIVRRGSAEVMLAGATSTRLHPIKLIHATEQEELADSGSEPSRASRPFDRDRTGVVLGEGAAAIVLEEFGSAQARGATIYAEVVGGATSSAAERRLVAHREQALTNVLRAVMGSSEVGIDDVGHVHAHGLGTRTGDVEESRAILAVFGGRREPLPVVAGKSYFGNLGAGSGMVELVASVLALQHGRLFRVLNYENRDPDCPVAAVTDGATPAGSSFINLSVTPQGQASAVVVRR